MRSSAVLTLSLAGLALASPILVKKALVTEIVTETVYVYATEGAPAPTNAPGIFLAENTVVTTTPVAEQPAPTPAAPSPVEAPVEAPVVAPVVTPIVAPVVAAPVANNQAPAVTVVIPPPAPSTPAAPIVVSTPPAAAPSPVSPGPATPSDYISTVLYYHNVHRANNSASPLTYDDNLASYANVLASSCNWGHDLSAGGGGYGQNIADVGTTDANESSKDPSAQAANMISNAWYNGELALFPQADYGLDNPDMSQFESWGHYSQVVWKKTQKVGCATAYCPSGKGSAIADGKPMFSNGFSGFYTVCNYFPAGNMGGEYGANVGKPLGQPFVGSP